MNRLAHHQGIHKFFTTLGLALYFSKPVMKHLVHIVDAMITKGFSGTLTDLHHGSFHPNHRTTLSHFFTKSPWEEETLLEKLQQWILRRVERIAKQENQPLFVSIDDTICQKTKPSSRATHAIQGCDWHYSHTEKKSIWGHSLVWLMVHTAAQAFPFAFRLYDKAAGKSKGELAIEMLSSLDVRRPVYVLMDSWYPSKALVKACLKKDFTSSRCSRRTGFSIRTASPSKRSSWPALSNQTTLTSSRWEKSAIASIVTKERSTVSIMRWCCSLGKPINR